MPKGRFTFFLSQVVFFLSSAFLVVILARALGPYKYGQIAVTYAFCGIFMIFFEAGLTTSIGKNVASGEDKSYSLAKFGYFSQLIWSSIIFLVVFLGADFWAKYVLNDKSFASYIRIASLQFIPYAFFMMSSVILLGLRFFVRSSMLSNLSSILRVLVILIFLFFWKDVSSVFYAAFIALLLTAVTAKLMMPKLEKKKADIDRKKIIMLAFTLVLLVISIGAIFRVDKIFIKNMLQNNEIAGIYALASNIASVLLFFSWALTMTLFPVMAKSFAAGEIEMTKKCLFQATRYLMLLLIPMAFAVNIIKKDMILFIFGSQYSGAIAPLAILIFAAVFFAFFITYAYLLVSLNRQWVSCFMAFAVLILALVLNPFFIVNYGYLGAAWATLICSVFGALLSGAYIFKFLGVKYPALTLVRVLAAILICFFLAVLALRFPVGIRYGIYLILFSLFVAVLHFSRELTDEDWQNVKDIFVRQ